jgi:hypothetical protein
MGVERTQFGRHPQQQQHHMTPQYSVLTFYYYWQCASTILLHVIQVQLETIANFARASGGPAWEYTDSLASQQQPQLMT